METVISAVCILADRQQFCWHCENPLNTPTHRTHRPHTLTLIHADTMPHAHLKWKCLQEAADAAHFPNVITLGRYTCRQQQYHCCCCCCCCRAFSIWISLPASLPSPRAPSPSHLTDRTTITTEDNRRVASTRAICMRAKIYTYSRIIYTHTHTFI